MLNSFLSVFDDMDTSSLIKKIGQQQASSHPEAKEPQDDLEIVHLNTPVRVIGSRGESDTNPSAINTSVQHNTSPAFSLPTVQRRLIANSTSPVKRARLDKNFKTQSRRCLSPIDNDLGFDSSVDDASFINSEQLH